MTTLPGEALREAIEAELALLPPESKMRQFDMGAAAAYHHVLSVLALAAPSPPTDADRPALSRPRETSGLRDRRGQRPLPTASPSPARALDGDADRPEGSVGGGLPRAALAAPVAGEGLREALVIEMENEGVVTWGDEQHRARFLALAAPTGLDVERQVELARSMGRTQAEQAAAKVVAVIVAAAGGSVFVPDRLVVEDDLFVRDELMENGRRYFIRAALQPVAEEGE